VGRGEFVAMFSVMFGAMFGAMFVAMFGAAPMRASTPDLRAKRPQILPRRVG
jgi:hypothetical protein